ncbi:MAG: ribonuclease Z [Chitinophagaceae bacterium]
MFGVTILGNNSAIPAYDRHPTAQLITLNDQLFLIDCGEGTQMQLSKYKIRRSRINHIFISHLHGDHYFGLPGLINTMGLLNRDHDLHIHAPAALREIICMQLQVANTTLPFTLHFHALQNEDCIVDEEKYTVECFQVNHRIECWGFLIKEKKKPRKINREKVLEYKVPISFYDNLRNGEDYKNENGELIENEMLTFANSPAKSYAYCADTIYDESIADKIKNVDLLYHESTYLKDHESRAASRFHSTSEQAASIAKLANAKRLIIGHFSSKYEQLDKFIQEAQAVFPNVELGLEGVTYRVL